jgi:hypothetical protein
MKPDFLEHSCVDNPFAREYGHFFTSVRFALRNKRIYYNRGHYTKKTNQDEQQPKQHR